MHTHRVLVPLMVGSFAVVAFSQTAAGIADPGPKSSRSSTSDQCRASGGVLKQDPIWDGPTSCTGGTYDRYDVLD
ncbi:hypothetical protein GCM10022207_51590 [Streptomyces lannensis]|uniref:Uncharacterized protein n=1 Tax=Streptomyces lannensis TaxID=766498 RepID=A0ABP7KLK8_9ACTN